MLLRMTHQTKLVLKAAKQLGHGTNNDILTIARVEMPEISATTVHRITSRLIKEGMLKKGPNIGHSMIIDGSTTEHDHFVCIECNGIKDIHVGESARREIYKQVPNIAPNTSLTITGDCDICK